MKIHYFAALVLAGACSKSVDQKAEQNSVTENGATSGELMIDRKNGFRNHHFGDDISLFPGLKLTEHQALYNPGNRRSEIVETGVKVYSKVSQENLKIGHTPLRYVHYAFYKGKFCTVELMLAKETAPLSEVINALKASYGPADTTSTGHVWTGKKAVAIVAQTTGNPVVEILSMNMSDEIGNDQDAAAQEEGLRAKGDL